MKFEPELSAVTGIPVYSSRFVPRNTAYAISRELLRIPQPPTHWSHEPVDTRSDTLSARTLYGMMQSMATGRTWKAKSPKRYAIEELGITEADIRSIEDPWLGKPYVIRLWNGRRIEIQRRILVEHGNAVVDIRPISYV